MSFSKLESATVLYVEDEEGDAFFMQEAFKRVAPEAQLKIVTDGQRASDYLAGRKGYEQRAEHPVPALVLLDLNLPVVPGFEVLKWMREQPQYKRLPVVVFSSSTREKDKLRSDELGADWYLEKPATAKEFRFIVEEVRLRMRKLLQNRATRAFLTETGEWTKDWRSAKVFPTTEGARAAALAQAVGKVDLYYLFGEEVSQLDFTISLLG